ncbi:MAG: EamA family transporter [Jatrophihabitans sp.]|uniref:EamA family transporter n=1 Tax=Jatrophihabitans sp. TaxID=1932789 RepID=UPI003F7F5C1C
MRAASGLPLGLASAALFGSSGSFASSLMSSGWSPAAAVTARVTIAALLLTIPALLALRGRRHVLRQAAGRIAAFGLIAVGGCQFFYFCAVSHLSISVALLLEYLGVVLVVGWMWLAHGRRPSPLTMAGGVLALSGLTLVLDIFGGAHVDVVGLFWGSLAAVGLAVFFVLSGSGDDSTPPIVVAWGGMAVGAGLLWFLGLTHLVRFAASTRDVDFAGHQAPWFVPVLGLAVLAGALAYTVSIAATRALGVTVSSFLGLIEVLFSALFAWVLVGQQPTLLQALGGAVVLGGIVLVRLGELRSAPVAVTAPEAVDIEPLDAFEYGGLPALA